MNRPQEKIKSIIINNGVVESDMAAALYRSPQAFNYFLNKAITCDTALEAACYEYFKKQGITTYREKEECMAMTDLYVEFTSIAHQHFAILANEIQEDKRDGRLDEQEKARLAKKINDMRRNINAAIDELESLIKN
jgi:hypothetical protein